MSLVESGCSIMPTIRVTISGGMKTLPNCIQCSALATKATAAMAQQRTMPGAARRRLEGAQSLAMSTATVLAIDDRHQLPFGDRLAFGDADLLDGASLGRQDGNFHLHGFEDHDLALE